MSDILYLASQSKGRQKLLRRCRFNYEVLRHDADECSIDASLPFDKYVLAIASEKMKHVVFPDSDLVKDKPLFVLTSDTLIKTQKTGHVLGKPVDRTSAIRMIKLVNKEPLDVMTGCVLEKKTFNGKWVTSDRKEILVNTVVEYIIEEPNINFYLDSNPQAMYACAAATVEGFGDNFLKSINGSYSAVIGVPIYELRQALKEMGFDIH